MHHHYPRALALSAVIALGVGTLAACGGEDTKDTGSSGNQEPVTVSVATFNEFGLEGPIEAWNAEHTDIKIEQKKVGTWDEAKENLYTKLAAGSGLSDIEAIEGDGMPAILAESDAFVDLTDPSVEGRWLDWKQAAGTDADGRLIGYGTDIGPEGICYRSDLFKKAGLPSDRDQVAALMGTWDDYFATGKTFVSKLPKVAWYDSSGGVAQAMLNQVANPFEASDNTIDVENPELEAVWQTVTSNVELSTRLSQWSDDWTAAFQNDGFATMACPGWMLGVVEGNADGVKGWDFANVFPGGGGNWGGSFLVVPAQTEHPDEAREVAAYLTSPESQLMAYQDKGTFPSQVAALDDSALTADVRPFFNDAPVGEILAERAAAITVQPYKGPKYSDILQAFQAAILRVDDGSNTPEKSWETFLSDVGQLS